MTQDSDEDSDSNLDNVIQDKSDNDTEYSPTVWERRKLNEKPETVALPGISRKKALKETTATATRYNISAAGQLALFSSALCTAGGDMEDMNASLATVKRH